MKRHASVWTALESSAADSSLPWERKVERASMLLSRVVEVEIRECQRPRCPGLAGAAAVASPIMCVASLLRRPRLCAAVGWRPGTKAWMRDASLPSTPA